MIGEAIQSDTFRVGCPAKSRVSNLLLNNWGSSGRARTGVSLFHPSAGRR